MPQPTQTGWRTAPKANFMEPYTEVHKVVTDVSQRNEPIIYAKPYNFVDFNKHGSMWSPDFFSIVRDPIEKVS